MVSRDKRRWLLRRTGVGGSGGEPIGAPTNAIACCSPRNEANQTDRGRFSPLAPLLLASALLAGACSSTPTPEAPAGDAGLEAGRGIYIRNCMSCHGPAGGGGRGPQLDEGRMVEVFPEVDDQIQRVAEGKKGMPAFDDRLSAEEIEDVVRFVREVL